MLSEEVVPLDDAARRAWAETDLGYKGPLVGEYVRAAVGEQTERRTWTQRRPERRTPRSRVGTRTRRSNGSRGDPSSESEPPPVAPRSAAMRAVADEAGMVHISELVADELGRLEELDG